MSDPSTSRIRGFYKLPLADRLSTMRSAAGLSDTSWAWLSGGGGLGVNIADRMSENVIACQGLPLAVALNFRVNGRDVLVPMAVEEPSVVAAASNAARLVRIGGGFVGEADPPIMTAQVWLDGVADPQGASARLDTVRAEVLAAGDRAIPRMVARGGGCREIAARLVDADSGTVVIDIHVNVGDAMGANLVNTVAEAVAPRLERAIGGSVGMRILSNLALRRMVRVRGRVGAEAIGGDALADGIARASRFAELCPQRAATHNKGIMNGVDAVALALGQDWRAIEAGAHAWAGLDSGYRPLATWHRDGGELVGTLEMPLAVGTVGGATRTHPGVCAAFELVRTPSARELAVVMAAAGLASNLAALRALAGEGIQKGHMRLHSRRLETETAAAPAREESSR